MVINRRRTRYRTNLLFAIRRRETDGHSRRRHALAPTANAALRQLAEDKTSRFNVNNEAVELKGGQRSTFAVSFSSDGTWMASSHGDHTIRLTSIRNGVSERTLTGHPRTPWSLQFHPVQRDILASGCLGGEVRVWDLHGGSEIWRVAPTSVISAICFHPRVRLLVIATSNSLYFWDWSMTAPYARCSTANLQELVRWVGFSPFGDILYTGIANKTGNRGLCPTIHANCGCSRASRYFVPSGNERFASLDRYQCHRQRLSSLHQRAASVIADTVNTAANSRNVLERLRTELDQQLERLHESLNRLFEDDSNGRDALRDVVQARNAASDAASNIANVAGARAEAVVRSRDLSRGNNSAANESGGAAGGEGDSRIVAVENPNYDPERNHGSGMREENVESNVEARSSSSNENSVTHWRPQSPEAAANLSMARAFADEVTRQHDSDAERIIRETTARAANPFESLLEVSNAQRSANRQAHLRLVNLSADDDQLAKNNNGSVAINRHALRSDADKRHVQGRGANLRHAQGAADQRHAKDSVADQRHAKDSVANQRHAKNSVANQRHAKDSVANQRHAKESNADQRHAKDSVADQRHAKGKSTDQRYFQESFADQQLTKRSATDQRYAKGRVTDQKHAQGSPADQRHTKQTTSNESSGNKPMRNLVIRLKDRTSSEQKDKESAGDRRSFFKNLFKSARNCDHHSWKNSKNRHKDVKTKNEEKRSKKSSDKFEETLAEQHSEEQTSTNSPLDNRSRMETQNSFNDSSSGANVGGSDAPLVPDPFRRAGITVSPGDDRPLNAFNDSLDTAGSVLYPSNIPPSNTSSHPPLSSSQPPFTTSLPPLPPFSSPPTTLPVLTRFQPPLTSSLPPATTSLPNFFTQSLREAEDLVSSRPSITTSTTTMTDDGLIRVSPRVRSRPPSHSLRRPYNDGFQTFFPGQSVSRSGRFSAFSPVSLPPSSSSSSTEERSAPSLSAFAEECELTDSIRIRRADRGNRSGFRRYAIEGNRHNAAPLAISQSPLRPCSDGNGDSNDNTDSGVEDVTGSIFVNANGNSAVRRRVFFRGPTDDQIRNGNNNNNNNNENHLCSENYEHRCGSNNNNNNNNFGAYNDAVSSSFSRSSDRCSTSAPSSDGLASLASVISDLRVSATVYNTVSSGASSLISSPSNIDDVRNPHATSNSPNLSLVTHYMPNTTSACTSSSPSSLIFPPPPRSSPPSIPPSISPLSLPPPLYPRSSTSLSLSTVTASSPSMLSTSISDSSSASASLSLSVRQKILEFQQRRAARADRLNRSGTVFLPSRGSLSTPRLRGSSEASSTDTEMDLRGERKRRGDFETQTREESRKRGRKEREEGEERVGEERSESGRSKNGDAKEEENMFSVSTFGASLDTVDTCGEPARATTASSIEDASNFNVKNEESPTSETGPQTDRSSSQTPPRSKRVWSDQFEDKDSKRSKKESEKMEDGESKCEERDKKFVVKMEPEGDEREPETAISPSNIFIRNPFMPAPPDNSRHPNRLSGPYPVIRLVPCEDGDPSSAAGPVEVLFPSDVEIGDEVSVSGNGDVGAETSSLFSRRVTSARNREEEEDQMELNSNEDILNANATGARPISSRYRPMLSTVTTTSPDSQNEIGRGMERNYESSSSDSAAQRRRRRPTRWDLLEESPLQNESPMLNDQRPTPYVVIYDRGRPYYVLKHRLRDSSPIDLTRDGIDAESFNRCPRPRGEAIHPFFFQSRRRADPNVPLEPDVSQINSDPQLRQRIVEEFEAEASSRIRSRFLLRAQQHHMASQMQQQSNRRVAQNWRDPARQQLQATWLQQRHELSRSPPERHFWSIQIQRHQQMISRLAEVHDDDSRYQQLTRELDWHAQDNREMARMLSHNRRLQAAMISPSTHSASADPRSPPPARSLNDFRRRLGIEIGSRPSAPPPPDAGASARQRRSSFDPLRSPSPLRRPGQIVETPVLGRDEGREPMFMFPSQERLDQLPSSSSSGSEDWSHRLGSPFPNLDYLSEDSYQDIRDIPRRSRDTTNAAHRHGGAATLQRRRGSSLPRFTLTPAESDENLEGSEPIGISTGNFVGNPDYNPPSLDRPRSSTPDPGDEWDFDQGVRGVGLPTQNVAAGISGSPPPPPPPPWRWARYNRQWFGRPDYGHGGPSLAGLSAGAFMGSGELGGGVFDCSFRVQWWDFSSLTPPMDLASFDRPYGESSDDIPEQRRQCNVIVPRCRFYNDHSIKISNSGDRLAVLIANNSSYPIYEIAREQSTLGIFSLAPETRGHCLFMKHLGWKAVSLGFSPLDNFVAVGLSALRSSQSSDPHLMGHIYDLRREALDGTEPYDQDTVLVAEVLHPSTFVDQEGVGGHRPQVNPNSVAFLPEPAQGLVYGTNKGHLQICRLRGEEPRETEEDWSADNNEGGGHDDHGGGGGGGGGDHRGDDDDLVAPPNNNAPPPDDGPPSAPAIVADPPSGQTQTTLIGRFGRGAVRRRRHRENRRRAELTRFVGLQVMEPWRLENQSDGDDEFGIVNRNDDNGEVSLFNRRGERPSYELSPTMRENRRHGEHRAAPRVGGALLTPSSMPSWMPWNPEVGSPLWSSPSTSSSRSRPIRSSSFDEERSSRAEGRRWMESRSLGGRPDSMTDRRIDAVDEDLRARLLQEIRRHNRRLQAFIQDNQELLEHHRPLALASNVTSSSTSSASTFSSTTTFTPSFSSFPSTTTSSNFAFTSTSFASAVPDSRRQRHRFSSAPQNSAAGDLAGSSAPQNQDAELKNSEAPMVDENMEMVEATSTPEEETTISSMTSYHTSAESPASLSIDAQFPSSATTSVALTVASTASSSVATQTTPATTSTSTQHPDEV